MDSLKSFTLAVATLSLFACSKKSPDEYLKEAQDSLEKGNRTEAVISFKNAIQLQPDNAEFRFLLGKTYIEQGRGDAAEKELKVAAELGYEPNDVVPLIVKALSMQFKNKEIINYAKNLKGLSPDVSTVIYLYTAQAYFQLNDPKSAKDAVRMANEVSEDSRYSKLGNAYLALNSKDLNHAVEIVDSLLKTSPNFSEALLLKGQLENILKRYPEANATFKKYTSLHPESIQGLIYLADSQINVGEIANAESNIDQLLKINANQPYLNQLKARARYEDRDFSNAKMFAERAIANGADNETNRLVAGVSAYLQGDLEQAYNHLSKIADKLDNNNRAKVLYNAIRLSLGYVDEGMDEIQEMGDIDATDVVFLIDSGSRMLSQGRKQEATALVDEIDSSVIDDPIALTKLSMLKLGLNDKSGVTDLERVIDKDPNNKIALSLLAKSYLVEGRVDEALALAKTLIDAEPKNTEGYNLSGFILNQKERYEEAAEFYNQSYALDSNDIQANVFQGQQAIRNKDYQKAIQIYAKVSKLTPPSLPSITTYFKLETQYGDQNNALAAMKSVYNQSPNRTSYSLLYAKFLQLAKQYNASLDVLNKLPKSSSLPNQYWILAIDDMLKLELGQQAESKMQEWTLSAPSEELAWRMLASFYEKSGKLDDALIQVNKGLKSVGSNNASNLQVLKALYLIRLKKLSDANALMTELEAKYGDNAVIDLLKGNLYLAQQEYKKAIPALLKNYEYKASPDTFSLLLTAYVKDKQSENAKSLSQKHLEQFPNDIKAKLYTANLYLYDDKAKASGLYKQVLEVERDNLIALNNLAWLASQDGNYKEAISYSKKAVDIKPDSAVLLSSLGEALLASGKIIEAKDTFAKAYSLSKKDKKIAKLYVDALQQSNENELAEKIAQEANL